MNMLVHSKGPMWIRQNGVDVNLGSCGATMRTYNNGLTCIQKEPEENGDVVQVVSIAKGSAQESVAKLHAGDNVAKAPLPFNWPLCAPSNCYSSAVEKMARRIRS